MSITVELDLPESVAKEARESGLLEPERLSVLLSEALRRERAENSRPTLREMMDKLHATSGEPMSLEEIQLIVDEVRAERANSEASH